MCSIAKVLLLLAVMVCVSTTQLTDSMERCVCRRTRNKIFGSVTDVQDVQIHPASVFCNKVEIIVTLNNNVQYCLDPRKEQLATLLANFIKRSKTSPTSQPTETSSFTSSTEAASI